MYLKIISSHNWVQIYIDGELDFEGVTVPIDYWLGLLIEYSDFILEEIDLIGE